MYDERVLDAPALTGPDPFLWPPGPPMSPLLSRALRGVSFAALLALSGCTTTVHLLARPSNALLTRPDGVQTLLPVTLEVPRAKGYVVEVSAEGYRTLSLDLRTVTGPVRELTAELLEDGSREVEVVLVKDHAHVGG